MLNDKGKGQIIIHLRIRLSRRKMKNYLHSHVNSVDVICLMNVMVSTIPILNQRNARHSQTIPKEILIAFSKGGGNLER